MEQYILKMPGVVYSGKNARNQMEQALRNRYKKAAVFTDRGVEAAGLVDPVKEILERCHISCQVLNHLPAEPTCDEAQEIVDQFKGMGADIIIAVGGGSVMDVAKLASIAATDEYGIRDLLEHPEYGRKFVDTLMIPTTAGTGAEATPNGIVAVPEQEVKVGIVNDAMIADMVILDGEMIKNLPKKVAASTGIDAFAHAIECYTSNKANPFSDLFAMEAMKLIFANMERACQNDGTVEAKTNMLRAAFYAGVAITASGTTAVHALSYPLGGKYHIPHGIANAMLLLPVMKFNRPSCIDEFAEIYDALGEDGKEVGKEEKAEWLIGKIEGLIKRLEIPTSLTAYGIGQEDLESLITAGLAVTRLLHNNKREVTYEDAKKIYLEIMGD